MKARRRKPFATPNEPERFSEIGPTGSRTDTDQAEELLAEAKELGAAKINEMSKAAVRRLLKGEWTGRFFTREELADLAETYAAIVSTAELLGRARVRLRQQQHEGDDDFHEGALTAFEVFRETPTPRKIIPLAPLEAIDYFTKLIPTLGVDPGRMGPLWERTAFTLAVATDQELLERVQKIIGNLLETGQEVRATPRRVQEVLNLAGVAPENPQYAEMVTRTNTLDAYTSGTTREMADPDVARSFPVWMMSNPDDSRTGPDHAPWIRKYFAHYVPFAQVRNWFIVGKDGQVVHDHTGKGRPFNCRCVPIPIYKRRWKELAAQGVLMEQWPPTADRVAA